MNFKRDFIHFLIKHRREMIYFILIYLFALIPGLACFHLLVKQQSPLGVMLFMLMTPSIPAAVYTEYSYRILGFKKPVHGAVLTFFLMNLFLLSFINSEFKLMPTYFTVGFIVAIVAIFAYGEFFDYDSCGCKDE